MMNPVPWLQMTNMISYQGLVRTFLRITLHNDTMMTHPMHLHGMWSELENEDGSFLARKHTIPVQPA
ncbi:multicopper oxidase domain-containing protein, partial [Aeromonas caviae]|uniref:multicopper oxidase domain-containing protein n=1 Tax=Aeromonas caviae TaxID=648 RepID=UPI0013E3A627